MLTALLGYVVLAGLVYYGVKGAWELLKFACNAVVWVVGAIFTVVGALLDYITESFEDTPEYEPQAAYITKADPLLQFINQQVANNNVHSDPDVLSITRRLQTASRNGENLVLSKVKNAQGEEGIANPIFVKAKKGYEKKIQDALDRGSIYEKKVSVAG